MENLRRFQDCSRVEPVTQHGRGNPRHGHADGHLVGCNLEIAATADHIVSRQHQKHTHCQCVTVAGGDHRIGISQNTGGQGVARAQHAQRIDTSALQYVQVEARREDGFPTAHDHDRTIGFGPIERLIDPVKNLRRQRIALAIVNSNGGNLVMQAVLDGFDRHKSRCYQSIVIGGLFTLTLTTQIIHLLSSYRYRT